LEELTVIISAMEVAVPLAGWMMIGFMMVPAERLEELMVTEYITPVEDRWEE